MAATSASASSSAAALLAAFALLLVVLEAPGAVGAPLKLTAFSSRGYPEFGERVLEALPEWPVTHHARVATSLDPETPELPIAAPGPLYYPSSPPPAPAPAHHELPSEASETATGGAGSGNVKTAA